MIRYYIVDAFAESLFSGNPAGVCLLSSWPNDALMQRIASENNLAETAFVLKNGNDYDLRWFTPENEIDLCGHATLATAFILDKFTESNTDVYRFHTQSGLLTVTRKGELFEMDFPSRPPVSVDLTPAMAEAIGAQPVGAYLSRDLLLLLESEAAVRELRPNMEKLRAIPDAFAVIVTAKGSGDADFVSRFFAPGAGIPEDPVTGSSHSTLIPFWAERLGKEAMTARQLSRRGGILHCRNAGDRVNIAGHAKLYLQGLIHTS